MHVILALQLTCSFFFSLSLCLLDRGIFLYIIEAFVGFGGLLMCLLPRIFHEQNLDMLQIKQVQGSQEETSNLFLLHILGGLQLCQVLISYLSRTNSNNETISRNAMTMWAQRICLDVMVFARYLSIRATVVKTVDGKRIEAFNLGIIPEHQASMYLAVTGVFFAIIIQLIKWPVYRERISMTNSDKTNLHLFLMEIYFFTGGLFLNIYPEIVKYVPGFGPDLDASTLLYTRSIGIVLVIIAIHIHNTESYYDSRDKAPVFQAVLFAHFTLMVHSGVYLQLLPAQFCLRGFVIAVVISLLATVNAGLGLRCAQQGGRRSKLCVTDASYCKLISSESENDSQEEDSETSFQYSEAKIVEDSFQSEKRKTRVSKRK